MTALLGLCGALRKGSLNRKLMHNAARLYGRDLIEADLNLPLYDGDLEEASGIPAAVQKLADQISEAPAILIASPEYNQAIPGVLKNALDWVSRTKGSPWKDKPVALMSAAAGRTGGARAQYDLRLVMAPFRARVIAGPEILIASAHTEFDETGLLTSERYTKQLSELMDQLKEISK